MHTDQQIENLARKVDDLRRDIQAAGNQPDAEIFQSRLNILERFMDQMKKWQMIIPRTAGDGTGGAGIVTAANSGVYLNGTVVQLGVNPLIEDVAISGASAFSIDFPSMVNFSTDVTTALNLVRGEYTIFNDVSSPILGLDAVGSSWVSGTELAGHFIDAGGKASRLIYNNTVGNVVNQIRVNPTAVTVNAAGTGYSNGLTATSADSKVFASDGGLNDTDFTATSTTLRGLVTNGTVNNGFVINQTGVTIQVSDGTEDADIEVQAEIIDIDVKTGEFFLNEGTTDTGASTAEDGMSLKLVDKTTGEAKYGNVTVPAFETVQGVGNPTAIVSVTGLAGERTVPFVDIVQTSTHITLNAGGDIDINTTGKYLFTLDTTWQATTGGAASRFAINAQVNTVDDLQTVAAFSVASGGGTAVRDTSQTFILDLTAGDNVAFVAKRINGGATIASLAGCRLTANLIG